MSNVVEVVLFSLRVDGLYVYNEDEADYLKKAEVAKMAGLEPKPWSSFFKPNKEDPHGSDLFSSGEITAEHNPRVVVDGEKLNELIVAGISVSEVKKVVTETDVSKIIARMADKPQIVLESGDAARNHNARVDVHMPGQALSMYNELMVREDARTGELEGVLNRGWRIIAACPQPDQRRPDYILGRYNPEADALQNGAAR